MVLVSGFFGKIKKWKNQPFIGWFWSKIQKLTPLYYTEKFWKFRIWSQIHNTLPDGALNGIFWALFGQKQPFSQWSPALNHFSLLISMGRTSHRCTWRFVLLAFFSHFWWTFPFFLLYSEYYFLILSNCKLPPPSCK